MQIIFTNTVKSFVLNASLVFLFQSVGTGELMAVGFNITPMFTLCLSRGMLAHISPNVPQSTVRWTGSGPRASPREPVKEGPHIYYVQLTGRLRHRREDLRKTEVMFTLVYTRIRRRLRLTKDNRGCREVPQVGSG